MVEVIVAAISAAALIITAAIPAYVQLSKGIASVKRDTKVTKNEVKNDHETNLREELDGRHNAILAALSQTNSSVNNLTTSVATLHGEVVTLFTQDRNLRGEMIDNRERLDKLEKKPQRGSPIEAP